LQGDSALNSALSDVSLSPYLRKSGFDLQMLSSFIVSSSCKRETNNFKKHTLLQPVIHKLHVPLPPQKYSRIVYQIDPEFRYDMSLMQKVQERNRCWQDPQLKLLVNACKLNDPWGCWKRSFTPFYSNLPEFTLFESRFGRRRKCL